MGGRQAGERGRGGHSNFATTGGRNVRTPFANRTGGQGGLPPVGGSGGTGGGVTPFAQQTMTRNAAPMYSNIIKRYANWKVCFVCGHSSKTCPWQLRRANHQEGYDRANANQYIAVGYNACTEAIHKSQLPH